VGGIGLEHHLRRNSGRRTRDGSGIFRRHAKIFNMKNPIEYTIVAVPFHADAATHDELSRKVNEKLNSGYELYGSPFFSEEMMYQAMTKPVVPN
jgi:hypothetical protein